MKAILAITAMFLLLLPPALAQVKKVSTSSRIITRPDVFKSPEDYLIKSRKLKDDTASYHEFRFRKDSFYYKPAYTYIAGVEADVSCKDSIGYILQPVSKKKQRVAFEGGSAEGISRFFKTRVNRDTTLYPVILRIKQLRIEEERREGVYNVGEVSYRYEMVSAYKNKIHRIAEYEGSGQLGTLLDQKRAYDSLIARALMKIVIYADSNMAELANNHPDFLKGVKVKVKMRSEPNSDTLFYRDGVQLYLSDFNGYPSADYLFRTYSTIDFDDEIEFSNGYLNVNISLAPILIKNISWIRADAKQSQILRHELYRMRLLLKYTYEIRQRIETTNFTAENYRNTITAIFREIKTDADARIDAYDSETKYGTKMKPQQMWEEDIDEELKYYLDKYGNR